MLGCWEGWFGGSCSFRRVLFEPRAVVVYSRFCLYLALRQQRAMLTPAQGRLPRSDAGACRMTLDCSQEAPFPGADMGPERLLMQGAPRALDGLSCSVTSENGLVVLVPLAKCADHEDASWVAGALATFARNPSTATSVGWWTLAAAPWPTLMPAVSLPVWMLTAREAMADYVRRCRCPCMPWSATTGSAACPFPLAPGGGPLREMGLRPFARGCMCVTKIIAEAVVACV